MNISRLLVFSIIVLVGLVLACTISSPRVDGRASSAAHPTATPLSSPVETRPDGAIRLTTPISPTSHQNPAFSPDGQTILFTLFHEGYNIGPAGLYSLSLSGASPVALLDEAGHDSVNLPGTSWNAATSRITFASDHQDTDEIWTMAPNGSSLFRVTHHTSPTFFIEPSFSPDGQWIVFEVDDDVPDDQQRGSLWKVRANGSGAVQLIDGPATDTDNRQPNWSPLGDRILFQRRTPGSDDWNLYTVAADGSDIQQVTTAPSGDTDASWSPDGKWVVYSTDYGGLPVPNIFIVSAGGGTPMRVTHDDVHEDGAPSWSPDGKWIAFESHVGQDETTPAVLWRIAVPSGVYLAYLRLNQVGYLPGEPKLALALTDNSLSGQTFNVVTAPGGNAVFTGTVTAAADRGAYGNFAHLYESSFDAVNVPGQYRVRLGSAASPTFTLSVDVYGGIISPTLRFFRVQRCGDASPVLHGVCHLKDGIAAGGPISGTLVNATGGWHDAGDYLKFLITTGASTDLMLTAYQRHPEVFADADRNSVPDVLDEVRIGLDWMLKLWDPANGVLYYQVGDESDHDTWRMPEGDDATRPTRPVWACEDGKGANVAGKAAAALALAASLWNDPARSFYSPTLASTYRTAAQQIYAYGKARPAAQSATSGFYTETTWQDDMALAAAELYRATGNATYLSDARSYAVAAGNAWTFDYDNMHGLAHYELARLDPTYVPTATTLLAADLSAMQADANANPFRAAVLQFYWGSAEAMVGAALEALWYKDLSSNAAYDALAQAQRDYVLGGNPWGVCWVNSLGVTWPHYPHHQVADLTHSELVGFWDEGPVPRADWEALGITLHASDVYTAFQSDAAVYHDDVADYATNEPTIIANALGLALASWYAPSAAPTTRYVYLPLALKTYASLAGPLPLADVNYWGYQIQAISGTVDALVASHYDMLVLEPTRTDWSSNNKLFDTREMVTRLKNSKAHDGIHRKLVIAYIDIGQVEDWRWYWTWSTGWDCTTPRPADWPGYILTCDPDGWVGNYPVAYWEPAWKNIVITGTALSSAPYGDYSSIIDEVIRDGFDGVYLDWVEGFENSEVITAANAAGKDPAVEMIAFIQQMRNYALARNPNFIVIQQNAAALMDGHPELFNVIDAIAQEGIWYDGIATDDWNDPAGYDTPTAPALTSEYLGWLDQYLNAGVPVFNCEYALNYAAAAYTNAYNKSYKPYVTRRSLGRLTTTPPPGY